MPEKLPDVIPRLSYEVCAAAADERHYRAEDLEGHRWIFAAAIETH